MLHAVLPLARFAPWLIPMGVVLMMVAIPVSLAISVLGTLLLAVGLAATLHRLRATRRLRRSRRSTA